MNKNFPKTLDHFHIPGEISKRINEKNKQSFLKDFVYGATDGTITTFAVVAGVVGGGLSTRAILILGTANLVADGFSMAMSNYLGTKAENQEIELIRKFESYHIENYPDGEKEEVRQLLVKKGFTEDLLEQNIDFYIADKKRWIDFMMAEEYGRPILIKAPFLSAIATFVAFVFFGSIPLMSYIIKTDNPFVYSAVFAAFSFFLAGLIKSKWTIERPFISAMKYLMLGALASSIAYFVGNILKVII